MNLTKRLHVQLFTVIFGTSKTHRSFIATNERVTEPTETTAVASPYYSQLVNYSPAIVLIVSELSARKPTGLQVGRCTTDMVFAVS